MANFLVILLIVCSFNFLEASGDWRVQRLNQFQQKYNNSQADIIFLLDVSGSVSDPGFISEKEFVKSLLSEISVQAIASRVAVVTFGREIQEDIDYIDDPQVLSKDKCTFTKEFARVKHRYGWATNMNGALLRAKTILDEAKKNKLKREHVNTVVFLLTDGYWNEGGSPYGTSSLLQDRNRYDVELFAIGVGGYGLNNQLIKVAGNRNNVIMASDFSDFQALATRIRGDQIEKLYRPVGPGLCGITCDQNAKCTCGTISGIYTCACNPGYYGSGIPGRCYLCPHGQYKTFSSPDNCKACPHNSITAKKGSTSIQDCICRPGFKGRPDLGMPCQPVECLSLASHTLVNGKITSCGKYYKETCTFECNEDYHISGEQSTSRKLVCLVDGTWSQNEPLCVATTCQKPFNPPKMTSVCEGDKIGDKCTYTCDTGYLLVGANERTCRKDGEWSHSQPRCEVVTCPKLRKIDNVNIYPVNCMTKSTDFNDACTYSCKPGFKFVQGDQKRICQSDGTWSGAELICKDLTPPTINCPQPVFANTDKGQAIAEINYGDPVIIDNSISGSDDMTLYQDPPTIKSPYEFPIGVTVINFTVVDQSGNSDSCIFRVEIRDQEKPTFTKCPRDMKLVADEPGKTTKLVTWEEPEYQDNSGNVTLVLSTATSPKELTIGTTHVEYRVQDPSKNTATCNFDVLIEPKTCPKTPPPINGALACNHYAALTLCKISCQNPYTFNGPFAAIYVCNVLGNWVTTPPGLPFPWPDCTVVQPPEGVGQTMNFFYFTGSCKDSDSAKAEIAQTFVQVIDKFLQHVDTGCQDPANAKTCDVNNVKITCGATQTVGGKFKRSTPQLKIEFELGMKSKESKDTVNDSFKKVRTAVESIFTKSSQSAQDLKHMTVNGAGTLDLDRVESVGSIHAICLKGQVFGQVKNVAETTEQCVSCLAGSYFSEETSKCEKCPIGTYTENPGLLGCPACPAGTTTVEKGTTNSTKCRKKCEPGYFSEDGLAPCLKCPRGEYQPNRQSTVCLKCPGLTTTSEEGMTRQDSCRMKCPTGMFSSTGLDPCSLCKKGFYQPKTEQRQCIQCVNKKSTYGLGAKHDSECHAINNCASSPCLNGGSCANEWNDFSCKCKQGYRGKRCEEEKDECADSPCYGEAACVDAINGFSCVCPDGYYGQFCSERHSRCTNDRCTNGGQCVETPEGPICTCKPGWTGLYCERTINECESSPCTNGGVCIDSHRGFTCQCKPGFTGPRCSENIDDCAQNNVCLHGTCTDGVNSFTCKCDAGYAGERCDVNIDECASNPCRNGALCVDKVNNYECKCAAEFHGKHCEHRYGNSNFDLSFDRSVTGYAETAFYEDLSAFTIAFWMKSSSNDMETGTVVSYAYGSDDAGFQDNALVVRDPNHMTLVVLGEDVSTEISTGDDVWHHVAITWSNKDGKYVGYKDGMKIHEGTQLKTGQVIPANGIFIIGQEQDEVGRNFSSGEAFEGKLSQFNMWKNVLSESEIAKLATYRCDSVAGNVIAWSDFSTLPTDEVTKEEIFCKGANTKFETWVEWSKGSKPSCAAVSAQCISKTKKTIRELNLVLTTCTSNGFSCGNQKANDPTSETKCPSDKEMMIRYECPYNPGSNCAENTCSGHGQCLDTLSGYRCLCSDGYTGKNCESGVQCRYVKSFANGFVNNMGNSATFSCKPGYVLNGPAKLSCQGGKFNHAVPSCVDVDECKTNPCGANSKCVNTIGSFKCSCLPGYKLSTPTLCVDIDECKINNGNCQDKCLNNQGSFTCGCRTGYRVSVDKRSCEDVNECSSMSTNKCTQICLNERGSYKCQCKSGYTLAADGKECTPVPCPSLSAPSNGHISQGYGSYKERVSYTCNSMYRLNGQSDRMCQADGTWTGKDPICEAVKCGTLGSPFEGQATKTGHSYKFSCVKQNGRLIGSATMTCKTGDWEGVYPRCIESFCPVLSPPTNGVLIGSSFSVNSAMIVKCNHGYMLNNINSAYVLCQPDGSWSRTNIVCVQINCGAPEKIDNGTITGTSFNYNSELTYKCNPGSGLSGPSVRTCQLDGEWSGRDPLCLYNSCGYPGRPLNGFVYGEDYSFGSSVSFSCSNGYRMVGNSASKCLNSGSWSTPLPKCEEIVCPAPVIPANGEKVGDHYAVNKTVTFNCLPGYSLKGPRKIKCGTDGSWMDQSPVCTAGICGSAKAVGPNGKIASRNYPNSYDNNDYCRWRIVVAQSKKAALAITSFKTQQNDIMEIRDGKSGVMLNYLTGSLNPLQITSSSNEMDVIFYADSADTADGFQASYFASPCGGQITSFGQTIESPNYPNNYDNDLSCSWQIIIPDKKFVLKFDDFETYNSFDVLEAWSHLTKLTAGNRIGSYYSNRGSFLEIKGVSVMTLKFTTDSFFNGRGFRATILKDDSI